MTGEFAFADNRNHRHASGVLQGRRPWPPVRVIRLAFLEGAGSANSRL
jgi:hypothetical protein